MLSLNTIKELSVKEYAKVVLNKDLDISTVEELMDYMDTHDFEGNVLTEAEIAKNKNISASLWSYSKEDAEAFDIEEKLEDDLFLLVNVGDRAFEITPKALKKIQTLEAEKRFDVIIDECKKITTSDILKEAKKIYQNGDVPIFEYQTAAFNGIIYNSKYYCDDELVSKIKWFEDKYDAKVYMVQVYGSLISFFYVSKYNYDWKSDIRDLKLCDEKDAPDSIVYGNPLVYVWNRMDDDCSEFGGIGYSFSKNSGGVIRVY